MDSGITRVTGSLGWQMESESNVINVREILHDNVRRVYASYNLATFQSRCTIMILRPILILKYMFNISWFE